MTARIEVLEVPAAGELHELTGIACLAGALRVAAGELDGHGVVGVAVDQELRHAEREPLDRGGEVVAAGQLAGRPAEQARGRAARQAQAGGLAEVDHAGLGDRRGRTHGGLGAGRAGGQAAPRRGPQGEVSAGRMADDDHPREVERSVEAAEMVDAGGDVLERGGPAAAAAPAEPPVLEVPDGPAAPGEVRDERVLRGEGRTWRASSRRGSGRRRARAPASPRAA